MKLSKYEVGKRYGKAIFELAVENDCLAQTHQELLELKSIFEKMPEIGLLLTDVRLDTTKKQAIVDVLTKDCSNLVKESAQVIFENSRFVEFPYIVDSFTKLYNEEFAILEGNVITAVPLSAQQKAKLEEKILAKFGLKSAELKEMVDPSIIGGVIVEANHQVIDGSLKTQLENIKAKLL